MTEMWLVRHGQTEWNLGNIVQGQVDIPLNETGIAQATTLARNIADTKFDAIYSSDLIRAQQTARIIAEQLNLTVHLDPRLREIKQGVWEGHPIEKIIAENPEIFKRGDVDPTIPRAAGAESLAEVIIRIVAAANDILAQHDGQRVLLSSHGLALAALYCVANHIPVCEVGHYIPDNGHPMVITIESPLDLPDFTVST